MTFFMQTIKLRDLLLAFGTAAAASLLGSFAGGDASSSYQSLRLPWFAPPPLTFPIVWTLLYILMGLAAYRVLISQKSDDQRKNSTLAIYFLGLALTALWPLIFFRFGLYTLAFFLIAGMIALGIYTAVGFKKLDERASGLYLPYVGWLVFALILTRSVAALNS